MYDSKSYKFWIKLIVEVTIRALPWLNISNSLDAINSKICWGEQQNAESYVD